MSTTNVNFLSPTVECTLWNEKVKALIDKGAQISLIDFDFMKRKGFKANTEDHRCIMGITGNATRIKGIINVTLTFEDQEVQTNLHVIEGGFTFVTTNGYINMRKIQYKLR